MVRRHVPICGFVEQLVTTEKDPLELSERNEEIRRRFGELPSREREALAALARISGNTCREVALRYGKNPNAGYAWAHAARRKLKPLLEAVR